MLGYRIQYGQTITKEIIHESVAIKKAKPLVTLVLIGCFIFFFVFLEGTGVLRDYLLPGNPDVTEAAFKGFVEDVRGGESVGNAITAFCLEIIENANMSE